MSAFDRRGGGWWRGLVLAALGSGLAAAPVYAGEPAGEPAAVLPIRVTYLKGEAHVLRGSAATLPKAAPKSSAPWQRLTPQARLMPGDSIRTASKARVELSLPDGSRLRLAGGTQVTLERADFNKQSRQVAVRMWLGRLWAHVARRLRSDSAFEVRVQNAVAGVRGTSFAVSAQADLSSVVKVYTGTVGVKKSGAGDSGRVAIAGPRQISRQEWEEVIATAMRQVRVTQLGEIRPVEDFVDLGADREWAMWNQARDGAERP